MMKSLEKLKLLDLQEESFNNKINSINLQIQSLNKLRYNFDKQRKVLWEEKKRVVNNLHLLVESWSPLFANVDFNDESIDVIDSNQKALSNLLSKLNESSD